MCSKKISSLDAKLEVDYNDVQNVCICVVIFPLLQYLLIEDLNIVKNHTIYILDDCIPDAIRSKLPAVTYHSSPQLPFKKVSRKIIRTYHALCRDLIHPYLNTATIYAQDHDLVSTLIGKHDYYLLSDGPDIITRYYNKESGGWKRYIKNSRSWRGKVEELIYGTPFVHHFGNNEQCKRIYLTEENYAPILKHKEVVMNSLQEMWSQASIEKQEFILHVFGVEQEDIQKIESKPIVLFTQPLCEHQLVSENEYIDIVTKIVNYYGRSQILIKTHPREKFDYHKYFPDVAIFDKPINIQLLTLLNASFEKAVTFFSSAVLDLPPNIQVDWLGDCDNPKIQAMLGEDITPSRCHRVTLPKSF